MAQASPSAGDKMPVETDSMNAYNAPRGLSSEAQHGPVDYDVERVEKVYKKLDLRIIPGKSTTQRAPGFHIDKEC
jgi:hypothetical protein